MAEEKKNLEKIIQKFSLEDLMDFFRAKNNKFVPKNEDIFDFNDEDFKEGKFLGEINFSATEKLAAVSFKTGKSLSERSGKKAQYEKARKILKLWQADGGIFIFSDQKGDFRFSLVYPEYSGRKRQWNNFRRFTYFVSKDFTNKTFLQRIGDGDFGSLEKIKEAFAIGPVTDIFYKEFIVEYEKIVNTIKDKNNIAENQARDFVLLFAIRTIFIGFIQKRKWIGDDEKFVENFYREYLKTGKKDEFYPKWIRPLFFEALNHTFHPRNYFTSEINSVLQLAPYLNGGLFREKSGYDDQGINVPDEEIGIFLSFLFSHSFTIEESSIDDAELQLNPEFLGIIFERLVNKADGAVYTPRTEVDLMCRLSLVKWLEKNLDIPIARNNLYELFFRESEKEEEQKEGSFSLKEAQEILNKLKNLAICDPSAGSGAFLVGMMQVLDEVEIILNTKFKIETRNNFERKKQIIGQSLYGVEAKEYAVWIAQLRLWLSLFVEAPDEMKNSVEPILPSLDFKVRKGDSLVQRIGTKMFPIEGHLAIQNISIKRKITELKKFKVDYFNNDKSNLIKGYDNPYRRELNLYSEILDFEIKEKKEELKKYKNIKISKNTPLFDDYEVSSQKTLFDEENKKNTEKTEKEIEELKEQKRSLGNDKKPLVWNIEFVEIFSEKKGFDIIIGNPPYVRQEKIEDPMGKIKDKKEYKNCLEEMVRLDFPDDFYKKTKINAQSDLYAYFYIRGLRLLNPQGIHTFICSNSWLDVGYGAWLQEFLLKRCPIEFIIDNHAKRSFDAADVNTIISVISAPAKKIDENHQTKFIAFKKSFEEAIFTENLLAIEKAEKVVSNDIFRVYPIAAKDLKETGMEYEGENQKKMNIGKYAGDKWGGKYLRAPDIFFKLIVNENNYFDKLKDIASILGYVHDNNTGDTFGTTRFIKSIKDTRKINLLNNDKGVINYGVKKDGNSRIIAPILVPRTFGQDHIILLNENSVIAKEFYRVIPNIKDKNLTYALFLNSTFFVLERELFGMSNLGGGGLKFSGDDVKLFLVPKKLATIEKDKFNEFLSREIKSIFEECGIDPKSDVPIEKQIPKPLPDRAELDKIVFDALDLSESERQEVYRAVCRLVWNRISKARSV